MRRTPVNGAVPNVWYTLCVQPQPARTRASALDSPLRIYCLHNSRPKNLRCCSSLPKSGPPPFLEFRRHTLFQCRRNPTPPTETLQLPLEKGNSRPRMTLFAQTRSLPGNAGPAQGTCKDGSATRYAIQNVPYNAGGTVPYTAGGTSHPGAPLQHFEKFLQVQQYF